MILFPVNTLTRPQSIGGHTSFLFFIFILFYQNCNVVCFLFFDVHVCTLENLANYLKLEPNC